MFVICFDLLYVLITEMCFGFLVLYLFHPSSSSLSSSSYPPSSSFLNIYSTKCKTPGQVYINLL